MLFYRSFLIALYQFKSSLIMPRGPSGICMSAFNHPLRIDADLAQHHLFAKHIIRTITEWK